MITLEQKEFIIKEISGSYTSEKIGNLVKILGKESFCNSILKSVPPGRSDLLEIMTRALEIAFERIERQKEGEGIIGLL